MSKCVQSFGAVAPWGLLLLALALAGCGHRQARQAELERMAKSLKTNDSDPYGPGLVLDQRFWADQERSRQTTVGQVLVELGASLRDGKVVDATGRELYFYHVENPHPANPRPQRTREEIGELEKKYRVIPMFDEATD